MRSLLLKNISYITLSQAANYLLPLITLPYISRVVGVKNFGALEFGYIVALYFVQAVEYSFDVSATRRMATISSRKAMVSRLFNSVFFSKILLWTFSSVVLIILLFSNPTLSAYRNIIFIYYLLTISSVFSQNWFFQGLQKLEVIAIANVAIKLIFTLLLFVLVKNQEDYLWVALSTVLGYMITSWATYKYAFKIYPTLIFYVPRFKSIKVVLQKGFQIFLSGMANKFYTFSGVYWAGSLLQSHDLGLYSAAHKLFIVLQTMMFYPINLALLPHLAKKINESKQVYINALKKYAYTVSTLYIPAMLILYFISPWIIQLLFGMEFTGLTSVFRYFIPSLAAGIFINLFMSQGLINIRRDDLFLNTTLIYACISFIGNYFFIKEGQAIGGAIFRSIMDVIFAVTSSFIFF